MTETTELQFLKGIGPKKAAALNQHGIHSIPELLEYIPRKYIDRRTILPMDQLKTDEEVTVIGKIESAGIKKFRKRLFYIIVSDGKGILEAVWFNNVDQFKRIFQVGDYISLSGKITYYRGYQMTHPDFDKIGEGDLEDLLNTGKILPVYPMTESLKKIGLNSFAFRKIFHSLFKSDSVAMPEILPEYVLNKNKYPARLDSIRNLHIPDDIQELELSLERMKYEEFLFLQLMLSLLNYHQKNKEPGISFSEKSATLEKLYKMLPFEMTSAQKRVVREIRKDMKLPHPMNRLLQGDVGSGKTLVAIMSSLIALDNGYQSAIMVPTEILAEQHYQNISRMLKELEVKVLLLTGSSGKTERERVQTALRSEKPCLIIGTHALIQEEVSFNKLGLVVIDEQHRFGVMQRANLLEKGIHADVLVMTATPIPRTLALTVYGNLDVSILDEMPPNRKSVSTMWYYDDKAKDIYTSVKKRILKGEQAFIVFPLIEESEKSDLKAATESFKKLQSTIFSDCRMELLHGRMKSAEKETIMRGFADGQIKILVTTTVVEVGVDVPNATIMLIEHAERFGLAQLHQLRGRVGRGKQQSFCILKTPYNIGENAVKRMKIMTETTDGFKISEEDLEIRGAGEFFGTRQHGMPEFKIAHPIKDYDILLKARRDAIDMVREDPEFRKEEHRPLRKILLQQYKQKLKLINIS